MPALLGAKQAEVIRGASVMERHHIRDLPKLTKRPPRYRVAAKEERTADGHVFASRAEAERYRELLAEFRAGRISVPILQPKFILAGAIYCADFAYVEWEGRSYGCRLIVEEVKPLLKTDTKRARRFRAEALRTFRRNATQLRTLYSVEVRLVER